MKMEPVSALQIFTFLFLMLGPFKVVGPFAKITERADPRLARQIALRATLVWRCYWLPSSARAP